MGELQKQQIWSVQIFIQLSNEYSYKSLCCNQPEPNFTYSEENQ